MLRAATPERLSAFSDGVFAVLPPQGELLREVIKMLRPSLPALCGPGGIE